jgi:hypothetical protein
LQVTEPGILAAAGVTTSRHSGERRTAQGANAEGGPKGRPRERLVIQLWVPIKNWIPAFAGMTERERYCQRFQIENDDPHPHVVFAFGLRITNCAPVSDSE